jgi:hypothetical protein
MNAEATDLEVDCPLYGERHEKLIRMRQRLGEKFMVPGVMADL